MVSFPSQKIFQRYANLVFNSEINGHEKGYAERAGDAILAPITALVNAGARLLASDKTLSNAQSWVRETYQSIKNLLIRDVALGALAIFAYSMCFHFNATCALTAHSFHLLNHIPGAIKAAPIRLAEFALLGLLLRTYGRFSNPKVTK